MPSNVNSGCVFRTLSIHYLALHCSTFAARKQTTRHVYNGRRTPLQTKEWRIPYAEEYLQSTFWLVRTQGSTPTCSHHVLSNINAPDSARKVSVSYTDQDADYFESYCSFPHLFQANSGASPINSAVHNVLIILSFDAITDGVIK